MTIGTFAQEVARAKNSPSHLDNRDRVLLKLVDGAKADGVVAAQATTSSGGLVTVTGLTASGVVIVTPAEALGTNIVLKEVVAGSGSFTVFVQDTAASGAPSVLNAKKVNYIVVSL